MRPRARTVVVFLLSFGLLAFFFRNADPAGVWAETRRADPLRLFLALVATGLTYVLRAWRWQSLLAPIGRARFGPALRTTVIGFAASALLPARAGEVLRPYLLARHEGLNATAAFATIILERLLDLATVLLLFAALVFTLEPGVLAGDRPLLADMKFWGAVAAGASVAGLAVLFALAGHPERLGRAALSVERVLPAAVARKVARLVETFAQGLAVMRQPGLLLVALVQSFPLWLSISAGIWLTSEAFHITFPFSASFLVVTILVVGVAVPTPGQVGGFHAAYQIAVTTFFAAPYDRAVGAAIVLHAISFLPVTIAGTILLAREGLTLAGARRIAEQTGAPGQGDGPDQSGGPKGADPLGIAPLKRGAR
jgi:glycosyltransferase 2 family protein